VNDPLQVWRDAHRELLAAKAEAYALTRPFRPPRPLSTFDSLVRRALAAPGARPYLLVGRRSRARRRVRR
jgi:hypothetical protein